MGMGFVLGLRLTVYKTLAEEIFKETFLQLKEKQILFKNTYPLCPYLLKYTYTFARQELKERGITVPKKSK